MKRILKKLQQFVHDQSGQAMLEYILVAVMLVLACYFIMSILADLLVKNYNELAAHICLPVP